MSYLPQTIGSYRVIAQLGQGGMARALLAMRQGPGGFRKLFVLKALREDLSTETEFVEMFLNEARLAALLSHQNVVQTHEIGYSDEACFFSMDYLEGQSLSRVLKRIRRANFPLCLHVFILADVLAGLHYAHNVSDFDGTPLNVVHRDISPGNVFLGYDGQVKLLDFGIAKAAGAKFETRSGVLKGKLAYMAPEQARAQEVDRRSDIFAVGVMLWEALAGRRMVTSREPDQVTLANRVEGLWEPISQVKPNAPPELIEACEKAMSLDPDDRFADADEFRAVLMSYIATCEEEPTRESLSALVGGQFAPERQELADTIAAKIASRSPPHAGENLIRRTASLTDLPIATLLAGEETPDTPPELTIRAELPTTVQKRRRNRWLYGAAAIVGVAGLAAVAIAVVGGDKDKEAAADDAVVDSSAIAAATKPIDPSQLVDDDADQVDADSAAAAARDSKADKDNANASAFKLVVSAYPADAQITIDGEPVTGNPYTASISDDDKDHRILVRADGYEQVSRTVRFDRDQEFDLVLKRAEQASSRSSRRQAARRAKAAAARLAAEREAERAAEAARMLAAKQAAAAERAKAERAKAEREKNRKPKAGDVLKSPRQKNTRKIDTDNPYN